MFMLDVFVFLRYSQLPINSRTARFYVNLSPSNFTVCFLLSGLLGRACYCCCLHFDVCYFVLVLIAFVGLQKQR